MMDEYGDLFDFPRPVWRPHDGKPIYVSAMTTEHVQNALASLKRRGFVAPRAPYRVYPGPDYESEYAAAMAAPKSIFIDIFEDELRKRGAQEKP